MVNTIYLLSFVETPRKFLIAELSIRKFGSSSVLIIRLFEFMYKKGRVNSNSRIISTRKKQNTEKKYDTLTTDNLSIKLRKKPASIRTES